MNKNKIFKALGVGALATLGLFTFTGCSLGENNADVINELKKSNLQMEETIDLLRDQNNKLNEQNNQLEDYINEFKQENAKITNEQAFDKIKLAKAKLETNFNGVRNNLRLTTIVSSNKTNDEGIFLYESYKTENNGFVINFQQEIENEQYQSLFTYEHDGKVYSYDKTGISATTNNYTKEILTRYETSEAASMIENLFNQFIDFEETADKVKSVEILENGNYAVTMVNEVVKENTESNYVTETFVVVYEITPKNQIKSMSVYMYNFQDLGTDEKTTSLYNGAYKMEFEYGVISENYINNLLQEAISKDLKAE